MRVMVRVKATKTSEAGKMPSEQLLAEMGKFNEELTPELRAQEQRLRDEIQRQRKS